MWSQALRGHNCLTKFIWCHDCVTQQWSERFRWEHWVVSLLALPEKHGLLLFYLSTLLLSKWLYQILTTQCSADRHLGLSFSLPRATLEFIPRPICPAVLLAQAFSTVKKKKKKRLRETVWDREERKWTIEEEDRGRHGQMMNRVSQIELKREKHAFILFLFFCQSNLTLSHCTHHREYHLAPLAAPYLDNACQRVLRNMNLLYDELRHRGWFLYSFFFIMSNKYLERQWAWILLMDLWGTVHLAATRCMRREIVWRVECRHKSQTMKEHRREAIMHECLGV